MKAKKAKTGQREARKLAIQFLYQLHYRHLNSELSELINLTHSKKDINSLLEKFKDTIYQDESLSEESLSYAKFLIRGVLSKYSELSDSASKHFKKGKIDRVLKIDLTILLLASYEIIYCSNTPPNVIINEAIELSHLFSTPRSGAFINGVLDSMNKSLKNEQ